jgi:hypothetical protein
MYYASQMTRAFSAKALCREVDIYNNIDIEGTRLGSEISHTRTDLTA